MAHATAVLKNARISAQKARLVTNLIQGMPVSKALDTLTFTEKRAARLVRTVLNSAISNAETNEQADVDLLKIARIYVDEGMRVKRFHARARGRGNQRTKQHCHITVTVQEEE